MFLKQKSDSDALSKNEKGSHSLADYECEVLRSFPGHENFELARETCWSKTAMSVLIILHPVQCDYSSELNVCVSKCLLAVHVHSEFDLN